MHTRHGNLFCCYVAGGTVAEWVREPTGDRTVDGSTPTSVKTFLFGTLAIPFTPLCQCLSDETVKTVGPFYLVSRCQGKYNLKIPYQSALECVTVVDSTSHSKPTEVRLCG